MNKIEFFKSPSGQIIVNDIDKGIYKPFVDCDDIYLAIKEIIEQDYPQAFNACVETIDNHYSRKHKKAVDRFLRCNFSENDNKPDLTEDGSLDLERVQCPLRGICEYENVICNPKYNTLLSQREEQVAIELASGYPIHVIADKLYISEPTIKNHRNKIYKKLNINSIGELINWAYQNKLIK